LATALLMLTGSPARARVIYNVINLGTLGGDNSCAYSINNTGKIAGSATIASGDRHAALFDSTGGGNNTDLGTLGGLVSDAYGINNAGQVVGSATDSTNTSYPFFYDTQGGMRNLYTGSKSGDSWTHTGSAMAINENGSIAGYMTTPTGGGGGVLAPRVWPAGGDMITLGRNYNEQPRWGYGINDAGHVVGTSWLPSGYYNAFFWDGTNGTTVQNLGSVSAHSWGYGINNSDQVVGKGTDGAFIWTASQGIKYLGLTGSTAFAINDNGDIVGCSSDERAILFDRTGAGNNIDLNKLINPASGWTLTCAYGINDVGWIVGQGVNPDGHLSAFLLTPEPTTLLLITLGGLILRKRKA